MIREIRVDSQGISVESDRKCECGKKKTATWEWCPECTKIVALKNKRLMAIIRTKIDKKLFSKKKYSGAKRTDMKLRQKMFKLKRQGMRNCHIAKKLKICPKTVARWLGNKEYGR